MNGYVTQPLSRAPQLTVQGFPARMTAYIPKTVQAQQHLIEWRNANAQAPDSWLRGIICEAFKRMVARRMQDTPPAELIVDAADDWTDIIGEGMAEELDRERVITGFKLIFRECARWPQPKDLLKRLPRRIAKPLSGTVQVDAIDEAAHDRSADALDKILESLG